MTKTMTTARDISPELRKGLLDIIPNLRAFALSLTRSSDRADDLVQETLVKAWNKFHLFQEGTNLKAWVFTIMRNEFYSQMRKRGREVQDTDGVFSAQLATHAQQDGHMDMRDFRSALEELPEDQREALVLIGANGFSYEEAAEITGVAVGTIKSRVSRARTKLMDELQVSGGSDYGPDAVSLHAVAGNRGSTNKN